MTAKQGTCQQGRSTLRQRGAKRERSWLPGPHTFDSDNGRVLSLLSARTRDQTARIFVSFCLWASLREERDKGEKFKGGDTMSLNLQCSQYITLVTDTGKEEKRRRDYAGQEQTGRRKDKTRQGLAGRQASGRAGKWAGRWAGGGGSRRMGGSFSLCNLFIRGTRHDKTRGPSFLAATNQYRRSSAAANRPNVLDKRGSPSNASRGGKKTQTGLPKTRQQRDGDDCSLWRAGSTIALNRIEGTGGRGLGRLSFEPKLGWTSDHWARWLCPFLHHGISLPFPFASPLHCEKTA